MCTYFATQFSCENFPTTGCSIVFQIEIQGTFPTVQKIRREMVESDQPRTTPCFVVKFMVQFTNTHERATAIFHGPRARVVERPRPDLARSPALSAKFKRPPDISTGPPNESQGVDTKLPYRRNHGETDRGGFSPCLRFTGPRPFSYVLARNIRPRCGELTRHSHSLGSTYMLLPGRFLRMGP